MSYRYPHRRRSRRCDFVGRRSRLGRRRRCGVRAHPWRLRV